ncbi:YidC/Oxa1 family membrane protein insertase [Kineococcus radiotolerans]|uniref:Membrane protein insertase YidC n=1 Tax=Kineococcus radiotolerans (strain ATCC BAA-149 / DSM 14245 / SRS30216) TaxID=266940 RepID=A6WF15_KINRD|nr:membrane protein insertase YidC [Kineococcus radiotolerans]ABS05404.1 60 kDa inner membrane insertion protein [Kineococcus radiotolerans SRS30216 = ATCC BAA-149]
MLDTPLETLHAPLRPVEEAVAQVLVHLHDVGAPWPLAVLGLVVLARTLLLPLFVAQQRAVLRAAALRPRVLAVQDRYRGRTDPASRRALQQEVAALHRQAGVNPLGGCLPGLLQAPVFLALTLTLQSGDTLTAFGSATLAGAPLSGVLTHAPGPATLLVGILLLLLTAATQVVTVRAGTSGVPAPTALLVVLPALVVVPAVHFPIGVLLYWAASGVWSAGQQLVARWVVLRRR